MQIGEAVFKQLNKTPKKKPCKDGEHDEVIQHPEVPQEEEEPMARVEAMRAAGTNEHEIASAIHNIKDGSITHGNQLSRDLLPDEIDRGKSGEDQKIWAICKKCHKKREVDQALSNDSTVEAKDLRSGWGEASQRKNNIKRAKDGGDITYKIPKNQASGSKGRAIHEAFQDQGVQSALKIIGI